MNLKRIKIPTASILLFLVCSLFLVEKPAFAFELPKVSNPFAPPIAPEDEGKPTEVFYGQLKDIPIPSPMLLDRRITSVFVMNGENMGIEAYTGRLELASLSETMRVNMLEHGWTLRGSMQEGKFVQIYHKDSFIAVISLSKQTINTSLEVVVVKAQENDFFPNPSKSAPLANNPVTTYTEELKK